MMPGDDAAAGFNALKQSKLQLLYSSCIEVCSITVYTMGNHQASSCTDPLAPFPLLMLSIMVMMQAARKVVFVGTLTAGGLTCEVEAGRLRITREGRVAKMVKHVEQVTYCAASRPPWQEVVYVTERCVMELVGEGPGDASASSGRSSRLRLVEIAPGIDLQKDVLDKMEFQPLLPEDGHLKLMDARIFDDDSGSKTSS